MIRCRRRRCRSGSRRLLLYVRPARTAVFLSALTVAALLRRLLLQFPGTDPVILIFPGDLRRRLPVERRNHLLLLCRFRSLSAYGIAGLISCCRRTSLRLPVLFILFRFRKISPFFRGPDLLLPGVQIRFFAGIIAIFPAGSPFLRVRFGTVGTRGYPDGLRIRCAAAFRAALFLFFLFPVHLPEKGFLFHGQFRERGLEFQSLVHISAVPEKGDDLITLGRAQSPLSGFQIQFRKLIGPFIAEVMLGQILQDGDPLVHAYILRLIQFVLKHITVSVSRSHIDILVVELQRSYIITELEFKFTERKDDLSSIWALGVSQFQHPLAVMISSV